MGGANSFSKLGGVLSIWVGHHFLGGALNPAPNYVVDQLDSKKSGDIYSITPEIVKLSNEVVAEALSIIFNRCVREGHFPDTLKLAKVIPIHKGDSVLTVSNYRPISLLPIFSKIMERLIYNQFIDYIEKVNH